MGRMRRLTWIWAAMRLVHLPPTLAVTAISAALGAILLGQAAQPIGDRWAATVASVLGSQIFTGAINDLVDRTRDASAGRLDKPLVAGQLSPDGAVWVASAGLALQVVASVPLGFLPLALGLAATGSALAYNLGVSRTPFSFVPYLVSFGLLPLWIAAGVGAPLERVAAAPLLVAPFAAAAHLANAVRDFDADATLGSRDLAQVLGRRPAFLLAWGVAMMVGAGVGLGFVASGDATAAPMLLGLGGLLAVGQGLAGPDRLWFGMLAAAVLWTAAWALATG